MANVCVYCGSSPGSDPIFLEVATELGRYLAEEKHTLIYGGGNCGLMGAVADAALEAGGNVIGVIPGHLVEKEVAHAGLTELITVSNMHERKAKMAELSDCFIAMPGGVGTLEEIIEVFVWSQLDVHRKACGLLNIDGYFDELIAFLETMSEKRFLKEEQRQQLLVSDNPRELLSLLTSSEVQVIDKWMDR